MNVIFVWRGPSPYRVDFFNELGKFCNLTVMFEMKPQDISDKISHGLMNGILILKQFT